MKDSFNREIDYMRISVTDRCNLRCRYCMPLEGISSIPMPAVLTFEEIVRVCRIAAGLGIRKIRLTGGEPLVRIDFPKLVAMVKAIPGIESVSITTNGLLLEKYLPKLLEAGLDAVNISLDTLDSTAFKHITHFDRLDVVLRAIHAALDAGLNVKVNAVLLPEEFYQVNPDDPSERSELTDIGWNTNGFVNWMSLLPLAEKLPINLRFIELMPIGEGQQYYQMPAAKVLETLKRQYPDLQPDSRIHGYGPATYYTIPGFRGTVGLIEAIHGKFCHNCNRIRLSSTGQIKPCLCYADTIDLKGPLRDGSDDGKLREILSKAILAKPSAHCFNDMSAISESKKMVAIGG